MRLLSEIKDFFTGLPTSVEGDRIVVAFSGGPDSTALLWGLRQASPELGIAVHAVHIHQGWDRDSRRRAQRARQLSAELGIDFSIQESLIDPRSTTDQGLEATARQIRYRELERQRRRLAASYVITGHHADDQIETVLIRILFGTGIDGLAGIRARHGRVLRPLLGLRRRDLAEALAQTDLDPVLDPTNDLLDRTRNRVRHQLLPHLLEEEPGIEESLPRLSRSAARARQTIAEILCQHLQLQCDPCGVSLERRALEELPQPLWAFALAAAHRLAGIRYPASSAARRELRRQLATDSPVGVDCGAGWRWQSHGRRLTLAKPSPSVPGFAYTVRAPGECEIPELAIRFRIRRGAVDTWMFRPSSHRAGLDLPLRPGSSVVVRSRRAGDRFRPLGCLYTRRLKDVLIDRQVPRQERDRLPLLEVDSRLAWIPGVTIDDACRVETAGRVWIAELESI